jgi:alpha-galactosidase
VVLPEGASYTSPWLYVAVSAAGLDPLAAQWHEWQRSLPAHPAEQPVMFNVWEAVYFRHDLQLLLELARRAARVGVERFVLDDGWFLGRRNDTAGLGDWEVDPEIWPQRLAPLIDEVRALGMQFGLWFEPEMVNPDSQLFRQHPDWALGTGRRTPLLERSQLVLDLTNDESWRYVFDRVDVVLREHGVDFVKWDHNRDVLDAGSRRHGGAPAAARQTDALYRMLTQLRQRHPGVSWESCAGGGGRIDLGVVEHVQRFWTSDMTDPLARQRIQRWTSQFVAPEYLGAHVSASPSHQTGRSFSLGFRAATALFGAFGIEWDLSRASEEELDELAGWVALHKRHRPLLHSGRMLRIPVDDPAVLAHGVVAPGGTEALLAHVQIDESASNRGVVLRVPGLPPTARYSLEWVGPIDRHKVSRSPQLHPDGPTAGRSVAGAALAEYGIWMPRRRPETVQLIRIARGA